MSNEMHDEPAGRCWQCGYLLKGLQSGRCPECGREFDRADRNSMNFGLPSSALGRWAISSPGKSIALCAFLGALLICITARVKITAWSFSLIDLRYYANLRAWPGRWQKMNWMEFAYTAGLGIAALAGVLWILRASARQLSLWYYRVPRLHRPRFWRPSAWLALWLLAGFIGAGVGWPYRIGMRWMAELPADWFKTDPWHNGFDTTPAVDARPLPMTPEQELAILRSAILHAPEKVQRITAIQFLIEKQVDMASILAEAIEDEHDLELRELEIRLLGIIARAGKLSILEKMLDDPEPKIRQAAADAISIIREGPPQGEQNLTYHYPDSLSHKPPILIYGVACSPQKAVVPSTAREKLEHMMLQGALAEERQSAARAIVNWPPDSYQLRFAEWGVFMTDTTGGIHFAKEQLADIPPFAHRVGNPAKELRDRISVEMPTWKPVIHLTADKPMAVDLEICIDAGRPWVVYPLIDDLAIKRRADAPRGGVNRSAAFPAVGSKTPAPLDKLDPPMLPRLSNLHSGYPWKESDFLLFTDQNSVSYNSLYLASALGVRWQSIIISPIKLPWMNPAPVGDNPRFAWWQRLREVNCSWIANRGESERFLYYDGPTSRKAPVSVRLDNEQQLHITSSPPEQNATRPGLYLEVTSSGITSAWIDDVTQKTTLDLSNLRTQPREKILADFTKALVARGLTLPEASALADCWKEPFFTRSGRRFLTFMTPQDYDAACPMRIRPAPTQIVRLGILWTEF